MKVTPKIKHLPPRLEVQDAYADHIKLRRVFGNQTLTPIEEGLARMAEWVKKTGLRKSRQLPLVEVWKKLPSNWKQTLLETGQGEKRSHKEDND